MRNAAQSNRIRNAMAAYYNDIDALKAIVCTTPEQQADIAAKIASCQASIQNLKSAMA